MEYALEVVDKIGKKIHLSNERWRHIKQHPDMHNRLEEIKDALINPQTIRYFEEGDAVYFYKEFKHRDPREKYLLVSVKYLNGKGFVITSFFTNRIEGLKWKTT